MLGVSKATVFFWVRRGLILPGSRLGRYRVWTDSEARAIVDRVAQVQGRLDRHPPVRVAHGDDVVWACPFCMFHASRSAPVRTHMRGCAKVWDADVYRGSKPKKAPPAVGGRKSPIASRNGLRALFELVLAGSFDLREFTAKVEAHLRQAEALQVELRRLRSEEDG
jgi:hypothetical protein